MQDPNYQEREEQLRQREIELRLRELESEIRRPDPPFHPTVRDTSDRQSKFSQLMDYSIRKEKR